jgi:glycosyltransferase involved in cell wall biosynthesis
MLHPLRGLYDTYHFVKKPIEVANDSKAVRDLQSVIATISSGDHLDNTVLDQFFEKAFRHINTGALSAGHLDFPGPFSRQVIHFLDRFALHPKRISRYAAISRTVRERKDYFPAGAEVSVLYPPPRIEGFWTGADNHLFTLSRLDEPKRIGLLIGAMRLAKSDISLLIGGTGPAADNLKQMANGDPRIKFLGHLTDAEIVDYYANALAIPFVPYDEDYGLITIEAMRSGKPVLTATDSGGVNEFVRHGETGLSVSANEKELADAIDFLCTNKTLARTMGQKAARLVEGITWRSVAQGLLNVDLAAPPLGTRRRTYAPRDRVKLVVAVTFPIYPPRGGGQTRIFHLYSGLAKQYDITIVSLTNENESAFSGEIAKNLREVRTPKTSAHQALENRYSESVDWIPVTDIVAAIAIERTPNYLEALRQACADADIVVSSHPYLAKTLRQIAPDLPMWFEAQDVEITLKEQILGNCKNSAELFEIVREHEQFAWQTSELVFSCTAEDIESLTNLYGQTTATTIVVPNGYDSDQVHYSDLITRRRVKKIVGLGEGPAVLFMGSWHGPNIDAVERVLNYSYALPSVTFIVLGSAGLRFAATSHAPNIKLLGVVEDSEKQVLLSAADLAINPMTSGTGSNLKMFDYLASGLPVISTRFGARGVDVEDGVHYICSDLDDFVFNISRFFIEPSDHSMMCLRAEELVRSKYSWNVIAAETQSQLLKLGFIGY